MRCVEQQNALCRAAKRFIQMLGAAFADLIGQPLSSAAKSGSASLTALAHRVAT